MTRLFVAAWPPADVARRLASLCPVNEPGVRTLAAANLHVTLRFIGDTDPTEVCERLRAAALPAATAEVGPAVGRLGERNVAVPVSGVDHLAAAVSGTVADLVEPDRLRFVGHITLARTRRGARSAAEGAPVAERFPIDRIRLIESRLHATGSEYTALAEFEAN